MDGEQLAGDVLHGMVADDQTFRFFEEDYVTISQLVSMDVKAQQVITASNSCYVLKGRGKRAVIDLDDFEMLRHGFSPEQIRALNTSPPLLAH
ncbi:hypothetical protein ACSSVW_000174 [Pseudoalteromonas sp. MBR-15]|jgi:hypothetical protein